MTNSSTRPLPRIRELPLLGSILPFRNDRLNFFMRLRQECPEIALFHLGPARVVMANSPQMIQAILVTHAEDFAGGFIKQLEPLLGRYSLLNLDGEPHRQQRKMMAPSMTPRSIATYAPIMADYTASASDNLAEGEVISIPQMMTDLTMRIIGRVLFGTDLQSDARDLADAIKTGIDYVDYLTSNVVTVPLSWPTPRNVRTRRALTTIQNSIQAMIDERRKAEKPDKDILSLLLAYRDENGQGLTDEQLRHQAITLFLAGQENVALALDWTWHLLLQHPDVYAAMQREVDEVLQGRLPTYEDLARLPYTLQILKESMRLYPSSYLTARMPVRDVVIDGYPMRKGDLVLMSNYVLHRSEALFEQPEKFLPERFSQENEKQRSRSSFIPFGAGPKICIGNHFSMQEGHLVLAVMAQRLRFELMPGPQVRAIPGPTLRITNFHVRVHRRDALAKPLAAAG
ncbi:MAG: cytochrome P450 [Hyalangium sp.]|uniref:cytochrome P450 n=1 Tax=Hyalangium sp. TaxID=2028555 RepID=UPI00389AE6AB